VASRLTSLGRCSFGSILDCWASASNYSGSLTLELTSDCKLAVMGSASLQIGQVAQKTGLSVDAIRFYEKSGLLRRPARTQGGYRLYEERSIADLEFIQKAQQLGFSLNEIRELFSIQRHPQEACEHVRDLIMQKLAVVRPRSRSCRRWKRNLMGHCGSAAALCANLRRAGTAARFSKRLQVLVQKGRKHEG
jgi:DNA-binding transcriptional MerR regulator